MSRIEEILNAQDKRAICALLAEAWEANPTLTLGEVVDTMARRSGAENPWGMGAEDPTPFIQSLIDRPSAGHHREPVARPWEEAS